MIRKLLIANRGEIACRIAATARELGMRTVAVCSEADRAALHTRVADEVQPIGAAEPRASYLDVEAILAAARAGGAEAIHPGYGFLAESQAFAAAVESAGLTFVGPTPEQIGLMGDKRAARALAAQTGVPIVPGAEGREPRALLAAAKKLGYPVIVKAALGGGGKGMRIAGDEGELSEAIESATRLARSAFGDEAVYVEKRLAGARHVEVQVMGDGHGGVLHLFERECSLQRRHQKVIEECPSPAVNDALRERLTQAALALARAVKYRGAGTVEFLLAEDGAFYFLEMNTRLQVEHAVTEMVTGLDLVRLQLAVAAGAGLPLAQDRISRRGHAIEARVYAEDAAHGFLPQAGRANAVHWPGGPFVRADHGIESGDDVPVHYDPILAKIVALGSDRGTALERLAAALDEARVAGVVTNLPFLRALVRSREVAAGAFDTEWIEREFLAGFAALANAPAPELALVAAALDEALGTTREGAAVAPEGAATGMLEPFRTLGRWRLPGLD